MKETVRRFLTGRERMAHVWTVLLMICAVLVAVGYSAKAGNAEEIPPPEPNPIEEEPVEESLPPEEETAQTPEDAGEETPDTEETPNPEEIPNTEETPNTEEASNTEEAPKARETPAGNSAGTKAPSASFTQEGLDELVRQAIDNIITPGMTRLEQAKAVWKFTKTGISYTGKSDKSDWRALHTMPSPGPC